MIFKFLIDKFVLNKKWTSLGRYMMPGSIEFTNHIENGFGGYCKYKPFSCQITIRPKYVNDKGIIEHEKAHARQYGRLFWIHSGLSMVSGMYRLLIELECYRHQVSEYNYSSKVHYEWIVQALFKKYNTNIPIEKIRKYCDYAFNDLIGGK